LVIASVALFVGDGSVRKRVLRTGCGMVCMDHNTYRPKYRRSCDDLIQVSSESLRAHTRNSPIRFPVVAVVQPELHDHIVDAMRLHIVGHSLECLACGISVYGCIDDDNIPSTSFCYVADVRGEASDPAFVYRNALSDADGVTEED